MEQIIRNLLASDSDLMQKDAFEVTRPMISILDLGKLLLQYSRDGDVCKVHELIVKGAPFNADWLGMTPLHYAAKRNSYEICEMLLRGGINKDAKTKVDKTALHFAVYEGNLKVVELLLSRDADVNIKDMLRMTALHWAVERGHKAIVRLLLKNGADVTVASKFGKTAIFMAKQTGQLDLFHDLEKAQQIQKDEFLLQTHESQLETAEAVNSIQLDSLSTPNFDLTTLVDDEDIPRRKNCDERKVRNSNGKRKVIAPCDNIRNLQYNSDSALEILRNHGITLLPVDEPQSNLLVSALEGGRKLVLSEGGRLVLNDTNKNLAQINSGILRLSSNKALSPTKGAHLAKPTVILSPKSGIQLKTNKNVKIISMETFKNMYGNNLNSSLRRIIRSTSGQASISHLGKSFKFGNVSTRRSHINQSNDDKCKKKMKDNAKNILINNCDNDLLPNIIEICSESDQDDGLNEQSRCQQIINSSQTINYPIPQSAPHIFDIPDICQQLCELKKSYIGLRQQFQRLQKQMDDYGSRLECLKKK